MDTSTCWNCEESTEGYPVIVTSEPETIWCLSCAWDEGVSFYLPESASSRDDIEEGLRRGVFGDIYEGYTELEEEDEFTFL